MRPKDREFTTALYYLRIKQLGLTIPELNILSFGFIMDVLTEMSNDNYNYAYKATQKDIDTIL